MVLPATDALTLSNNAIIKNDKTDLQTEISITENRIRTATSFGLYSLIYNATIIGNPAVDPRTQDLPSNQRNYYDAFVNVGYIVGVDQVTGYWSLNWESQGAETLVAIYSFKTTFNPSSIITQTIDLVDSFFYAQRPVIHVQTTYSGDIDESAFGGSSTIYYEFTIVADQETDTSNFSATLKTYLVTQGIGYTDQNCNVYQMVA